MRKLNDLSQSLLKHTSKAPPSNLKKSSHGNGKGIFVPELIDIICPNTIPEETTRPSTFGTYSNEDSDQDND